MVSWMMGLGYDDNYNHVLRLDRSDDNWVSDRAIINCHMFFTGWVNWIKGRYGG